MRGSKASLSYSTFPGAQLLFALDIDIMSCITCAWSDHMRPNKLSHEKGTNFGFRVVLIALVRLGSELVAELSSSNNFILFRTTRDLASGAATAWWSNDRGGAGTYVGVGETSLRLKQPLGAAVILQKRKTVV